MALRRNAACVITIGRGGGKGEATSSVLAAEESGDVSVEVDQQWECGEHKECKKLFNHYFLCLLFSNLDTLTRKHAQKKSTATQEKKTRIKSKQCNEDNRKVEQISGSV